ncbi:hypothetical protein HDU98_003290 [Podochytrium sp. JEL0797]|nr:hypothetical protein HDU98_003290 [Podochytrium sp. JEL0797]
MITDTPTDAEIALSNLFIAASDGSLPLVKHFLAQPGTTLLDQDEQGYTVFHAASSYNHLSLMEYLLSLLPANTPLPTDLDGDSALHVAETPEMAQLLLTHDKTLATTPNHEGTIPIASADEEGHVDLVAFLRTEHNKDYVTLAEKEEQEFAGISEEDLMHVLSAADMHVGEDGEQVLNINMERLQQLVESGQLDSILARQRAVEEKEGQE